MPQSAQSPTPPSTLAEAIRAKYPGVYDDVTDESLETAYIAKHPEYKDYATDFQGQRDAVKSARILSMVDTASPTVANLIRLLPAGARNTTADVINRSLPGLAGTSAALATGGLGAIPAAAAMGALGRIGEDTNSGIMDPRTLAVNAAKEGAMQGGAQAIAPMATMAAPAMQSGAERMLRLALPESGALNQGGTTLGRTVLEEGAAPTLPFGKFKTATDWAGGKSNPIPAGWLGTGGMSYALEHYLHAPPEIAALPIMAKAVSSPLVTSTAAQALFSGSNYPQLAPIVTRAILSLLGSTPQKQVP